MNQTQGFFSSCTVGMGPVLLTGSKDLHKKINYLSVSLGGWGALEHLPASKMVLVRNRLRQAVLQLPVVLTGKRLSGKTRQVTGKIPWPCCPASAPAPHRALLGQCELSSEELQAPVGPCPGGVSDAGGTKRREKHFIRKLGVSGWLRRVSRVQGWSCAAPT